MMEVEPVVWTCTKCMQVWDDQTLLAPCTARSAGRYCIYKNDQGERWYDASAQEDTSFDEVTSTWAERSEGYPLKCGTCKYYTKKSPASKCANPECPSRASAAALAADQDVQDDVEEVDEVEEVEAPPKKSKSALAKFNLKSRRVAADITKEIEERRQRIRAEELQVSMLELRLDNLVHLKEVRVLGWNPDARAHALALAHI